MKTDFNYIKTRLKRLNETTGELKKEFKKSKVSILEDLYLEIQCYANEIEGRINKVERGLKNNGKNRKRRNNRLKEKSHCN